ncbi:MAG TPA: hypothetical protein VIT23_14210, partial [Terrimicrobiaceae bacterium]
EADARLSHLRRGWYWGSQEFREKLEQWIGKVLPERKARGYHSALERRSHDLAGAEKLLVESLASAGLREEDLPGLKGSDPRKLALASLLWKTTTASQGWLSERLWMKSAANVSQQLRRMDEKKLHKRLPKELAQFINDNNA